MFNQGSGYSLSDIAAVSRNNDGGFGDGNGWWVILLFLFAFGGWGRGNNGFGLGNGEGGNTVAYVPYGGGVGAEIQRGFDTQSMLNKLDGITYGISDGFYAVNTGMLNGFNSVNNNLCNRFSGVDNAICTLGYQNAQLINGVENTIQDGDNATQIALMQGFNGVQAGQTALSTQLAQCCCDNRAAIADVKYQMATDTCAIQTSLANATRDLIDNGNANFRSITDRLTAMEMSAKDDKIAKLLSENQGLKFAASQSAQNAYLINQLNPCPVPAYVVANPNCCYQPTYSACNNGCGNFFN